MDTDQSSTFLSSIQSEIAKYQLLIEEENQKLKRYKVSVFHGLRLRALRGLSTPLIGARRPSRGGRFCSLADRKHPAEAQLPSFHHGAAEDAGRASAADALGGEGIPTRTLIGRGLAQSPSPTRVTDGFSPHDFFFLPGKGETKCQKSSGGQVSGKHTSSILQSHFPSLSHTQILYIVCHIHINEHGWPTALLLQREQLQNIKNCAAAADRLSDGSALSMCPSALTHDRRKDVLRLSCYFHNKM